MISKIDKMVLKDTKGTKNGFCNIPREKELLEGRPSNSCFIQSKLLKFIFHLPQDNGTQRVSVDQLIGGKPLPFFKQKMMFDSYSIRCRS